MSQATRNSDKVSQDDIDVYLQHEGDQKRQLDAVWQRFPFYTPRALHQVWELQVSRGMRPHLLLSHVALYAASRVVKFPIIGDSTLTMTFETAIKTLRENNSLPSTNRDKYVGKLLTVCLPDDVCRWLEKTFGDIQTEFRVRFEMFLLFECLFNLDAKPLAKLLKFLALMQHERCDWSLVTAVQQFPVSNIAWPRLFDCTCSAILQCVNRLLQSDSRLVKVHVDSLLRRDLALRTLSNMGSVEGQRRYHLLILLLAKLGAWVRVRMMMCQDTSPRPVINLMFYWVNNHCDLLAVEVLNCFYSLPRPLGAMCGFSDITMPRCLLEGHVSNMRDIAKELGLNNACIWLRRHLWESDVIPHPGYLHPSITLLKIYLRLFVYNDFSPLWKILLQRGQLWCLHTASVHERNVALTSLLLNFNCIISDLLDVAVCMETGDRQTMLSMFDFESPR